MSNLEYYDWKSNLKLNIMIMKFMGLWPEGEETYKPGLYMAYSRFVTIFFVLGHILSQGINIYFVRDNLEDVVGIIYVLLIEIMAGIKALLVIRNMKILKSNINILSEEWFQPKTIYQKEVIEPSIKFWRKIYRSFLIMCFACNAFLSIYPILDKNAGDKRLPVNGWYPYNYKQNLLYPVTYVFQMLSTIYLTLIHVNVDTMISGFNVYTGCQFDILSDDLRNFVKNINQHSSDVGGSFIKCVVHHKQILSFVEGCSKFFNWIMIWHLILSGVTIGITMFQLTLVVPLSNEFYSLVSYGLAIIIQIFMYCWFGNEVTVKSDLVSYAVFESEWTNLSSDIKINLLIFTANVLKPIRISALNIFELSLNTFMSILKTAWSYFALLYQLSAAK